MDESLTIEYHPDTDLYDFRCSGDKLLENGMNSFQVPATELVYIQEQGLSCKSMDVNFFS